MSRTYIKNPERRDRMLLLNAFAISLMTLLGAVGGSMGFDRLVKANTGKYRTHSLFRQGCLYYRADTKDATSAIAPTHPPIYPDAYSATDCEERPRYGLLAMA